MTRFLRTSLPFLLVVCLLVLQSFAQTEDKRVAEKRPFAPGEVLQYEAKLSRIIRGITVGDLTFTVADSPTDGIYLIKAEAVSKGTLLSIARYSFLQQYQSTIGIKNFRALKTTKHDVQKDRIRDSEANFDYGDKRVTFVETNPNDPTKPPRKIASVIPDQTHDIISGIYDLRLLPLAVGKTFDLTVSDSGLVYQIPVKVTARELQKTVLGKVWCFRVEPDVFGPGRMIEKEGSMMIWITDDARRIPVRSQINAAIGRIEIKLRSVKPR
ncbi:MAG TPA: DUF3108 domain-containing protein [Pyrinomonadaceae bacterium]|nr:DUF3108 domain-containing protein [Pyrinomonadaceae bacterium]